MERGRKSYGTKEKEVLELKKGSYGTKKEVLCLEKKRIKKKIIEREKTMKMKEEVI